MARGIASVSIVTAAVAVGFAFACVDLFHGTDFKTLCTESPTDPQCGGDGAIEGGASDGGGDATKPEIDFCKLTSGEAKERAIRACAYLGACGGSIENGAFGDCVSRAQLAMDCAANPTLRPAGTVEKLWKCLANVASCKDVDTCVFGGPRQDCGDLPTGKYTQCSTVAGGNVRIECTAPGGAASTRFETCVLAGQRCTNSGASLATCTGPKAYSCAVTECDGTNVVACQGTSDRGYDCSSVGGGACITDPLGPACAPGAGARACDDAGSAVASCDDAGVARACVGGKEVTIDCPALGLACDDSLSAPTYDPAARCVARGLTPCADPNDGCSGENLRGCVKGEVYTAQCTAIGLGKCTEVSGRAVCARP